MPKKTLSKRSWPHLQVKPMKARYESFGGLIRIETPPATIYVDKNYMRELGYPDSELWSVDSPILSAPIDVHFALTNRCPLECKYCYKLADKNYRGELSLAQVKEIIDVLEHLVPTYRRVG